MIPKLNSAHGSDTRNIINRAIEVLNRLGVDVQTLVAEGQLTEEQYAELITVINGLIKSGHVDKSDLTPELRSEIDKLQNKINKGEVSVTDIDPNKGKFDQTYMSDELLQQIAGAASINAVPADGSLTQEKYADKSITEKKTTFFKKTKNLFDGTYHRIVIATTAYRANNPNDDGVTAVVGMEPNKEYTVKVHGESDRFRIGVLNTPLPNDITEQNTPLDRPVITEDSLKEYTFTNDDLGQTMLVMVSYSGQTPKIQIEENSSATEYVEPFVLPAENLEDKPLEDKSITPEKTTFMKPRNLFNGNYESGMIVIGDPSDLNAMYARDSYDPYDGKVAVIPVEPNTQYTFKIIEDELNVSNKLRVGFSEEYPVFQWSDNDKSWLNGVITEDEGVSKEGTVTSFENSNYMSMYISNSGDEPKLIVSEGDEALEGGFYLPSNFLSNSVESTDTENVTGFMPYGNFSNKYETSPEIDTWNFNPDTLTLNEFYQLHEDLRNTHPGYITRTVIGYAGTAEKEDDTNLPIYEYTFEEIMADNDIEQEKPLLLVQAAIHGYERLSAYNAYLFFKDLCDRRNEDFDYIRDNFKIKYIPVASPYSFLNNQRKNASGVDVNRNFESDWSYVDDGGSPTGIHGGESPMSEKETIYLDAWYSENSKAIGMIDIHNTSAAKTTSQGKVSISWMISRSPAVKNMTQLMISSLSRKWRQEIPGLSDLPEGTNFAYVNSGIGGTARNHVYVKYGIPPITIDPAWTLSHIEDSSGNQVVSDAVKNDKYACIVNNDIVGATIFGFIKWFA